jgi:hypothetical protein
MFHEVRVNSHEMNEKIRAPMTELVTLKREPNGNFRNEECNVLNTTKKKKKKTTGMDSTTKWRR